MVVRSVYFQKYFFRSPKLRPFPSLPTIPVRFGNLTIFLPARHYAGRCNAVQFKKGKAMVNPTRLLKTFKITEENLNSDPLIKKAYASYREKRYYFSEARKELSEVIERLHDTLDASLRSMGHVP